MNFITGFIVTLFQMTIIFAWGLDSSNSLVEEDVSSKSDFSGHDMYYPKPEGPRFFKCGYFMDNSLEETLVEFIEGLQVFVSTSALNIIGFKQRLEEFTNTFEDIAECMQTIKPSSVLLDIRFQFASYMFQTMQSALNMLFYFRKSRSNASDLVCKVVHLNARLLAFLDNNGVPNLKLFGFEEKVERLSWTLAAWERSFGTLKDVPVMERLIFESQSAQALNMLGFLTGDQKGP